MPGTARIGPIETTGLLGASRIRSARGQHVDDTGGRPGVLDPDLDDRESRRLSVQSYPVLLEVHGPSAGRLRVVRDRHVCLDPVVGHRQQPEPGVVGEPATGQRGRHLRERVAGVHQLGPDEMGSDVAVAEGEPERLDLVRPQLVQHLPGLAGPAPAAFDVVAAAEGVQHGVEVRADPQPVEGDVVGGVHDDGDLGVRVCRPDAGGEPRSADASGENRDAHRDRVVRAA